MNAYRFGSVVVAALLLSACGGAVGDPSPESSTSPPVVSRPVPPVEGTAPPRGEGPDVVAEGLGSPSALVLDGDLAVFTTRSIVLNDAPVAAGGLFVADKKVGPALMIAMDHRGAAYDALATDGIHAFVATSDGRIVTTRLAGGEETLVADVGATMTMLVAAGDKVLFAESNGIIGRVAKAGGAPETLATIAADVRSIVADEHAVFVATAPKDGSTDDERPSIVRIDLESLETKTIAVASGEPCAMIKDGERLFFTTAQKGEGAVQRVSTDGAGLGTVASGSFAACAIAVDEQNLFFATTTPSSMPVRATAARAPGLGLMRAAIAGGTPTAIPGAERALPQPGAVAVDGTHVYWLTDTGVLRLAKR